MKRYVVKVSGEVSVYGETHADVKECLKGAKLECPSSQIRFLDIDSIKEAPEETSE